MSTRSIRSSSAAGFSVQKKKKKKGFPRLCFFLLTLLRSAFCTFILALIFSFLVLLQAKSIPSLILSKLTLQLIHLDLLGSTQPSSLYVPFFCSRQTHENSSQRHHNTQASDINTVCNMQA